MSFNAEIMVQKLILQRHYYPGTAAGLVSTIDPYWSPPALNAMKLCLSFYNAL
jgi:hypothetical protein